MPHNRGHKSVPRCTPAPSPRPKSRCPRTAESSSPRWPRGGASVGCRPSPTSRLRAEGWRLADWAQGEWGAPGKPHGPPVPAPEHTYVSHKNTPLLRFPVCAPDLPPCSCFPRARPPSPGRTRPTGAVPSQPRHHRTRAGAAAPHGPGRVPSAGPRAPGLFLLLFRSKRSVPFGAALPPSTPLDPVSPRLELGWGAPD